MSDPKSQPVEMLQAFCWTCPECGRDRFERAIIAEMSPEEMQELRDEHGVQPWEDGEFCTFPETVHCPDCNLEFSTHAYNT